jgi:succinyl-diaminopimelate desuccinylase
VPPGEGWRHDPFSATIEDGLIYGRGAADMKSGIAAFIAAVGRTGNSNGRISLAITNDEEADSINGTDKLLKWATAQGHAYDFAIVGEPSATARVGDSIKIGRRGSFWGGSPSPACRAMSPIRSGRTIRCRCSPPASRR